jgi:hypothetical protein
MDLSPVYHALLALAAQTAIGLLTGNWWAGAAFGAAFYLGREHAQAEYRWIKEFGDGKRSNMPAWGGFDPRVWSNDVASWLDWVLPLFTVVILASAMQ